MKEGIMSRVTTYLSLTIAVLIVFFAASANSQDLTPQLNQLRTTLKSNPEDIGTRLQLINLLFQNGNYREVIDVSQKAIKILPTRSSLYFYTGESYRRLGNADSAYLILKKGYEIKPYNDLSESYAMVLISLKKSEEAAPIIRTLAQEKPGFVDKHLSAGSLAYKSGKLDVASDELLVVYLVDKTKLSKDLSLFVEFNQNFESYVLSNNTDAAVRAFTTTLKARFGETYDFTSLGESFRCLLDQKQVEAARDLFEEFNRIPAADFSQLTIDKKFLAISHNLMLQCPKLKDLGKSVIRGIIRSRFGLPDADVAQLVGLYDFMIAQGATQLAAELSNKILDTTSAVKEPYLRIAEIFMQSNRIQDAMQSLGRFFIREKIDELGYTSDFVNSFQVLLNQKRVDDAEWILLHLSDVNTQDLAATYVILGESYTRMGSGEKAIVILNKVLAIDPSNHVASLKLGEAYYAAGRYDEIIRSLSETTDLEGLRYLALAYEKKVMLTESNKAWQSVLVSAQDTAQSNEAKDHIRQNTIILMSPQYQQLRAQAAMSTAPLQLAVTKPASAVEDNTRGIALVTSDNTTVTFEGFAGSDSPIDTIMVNNMMVHGVTPTPEEISGSHIAKPYVVKFSTDISLPPAQKSEVEVMTTDSLGNRITKKYVVDVQAQRASTGALPTVRAFVVGISQYADKSLSLKYAADDANLFYQRMRDPTTIGIPASNITLLTNSSATREGILDGLESVFKTSFENDVVMIYLAMHGVTDEGLLYFIPYDAKVSKLRTSAISGLDFDYLVKTKGAGRKVIMFVDACHAGAAASSLVFGGSRGVEALPALLAEMAKSQPGLSVFSASDAGQVSREGDEWGGHGVFTYYLLKAMTTPSANTNADQFIQLREIVDYVRDKVTSDTKGKQTPVFKCFGCDPNMPLFYSK